MLQLTIEERDRRWEKVREEMAKRDLGTLVVWSSFGHHGTQCANLRYLTNAKSEGYLVFPVEGEPTIIKFVARSQPSWVTDFRCGHPIYSRTIARRLKELGMESTKVGLVGLSGYEGGEMGFPYAAYIALSKEMPKARFEDATDLVERIRNIKSEEEIKCFELGGEIADQVFQSVVSTARPGVRDQDVTGVIRAILLQNGCDADSMILFGAGKELVHAGQGGQMSKDRTLEAGDMILTEFDAKIHGYMVQFNQPYCLGMPSREWSDIMSVATEAFNNGLNVLKPGITFGELDAALLAPAQKAGYINLNPSFHGLGLSLEEPLGSFPIQPEYKPDLTQVVQAGMVIEIEPHVVLQDEKKGIHLGCPVLVTDKGYRLLNKGWRPEIKITAI